MVLSCSSQNDITNNNTGTENNDWSIPINEVFDGGPGRDGIPSVDAPRFVDANASIVSSYMSDSDLVIGLKIGNEIKAYPHRILDWHEIVNDEINNQKIAINYCPLTGTAFAWEGKISNNNTTFGVSGLLYNTNLILYDRLTNSFWAQLKLESVNGTNIGKKPSLIAVYETTWGTWKSLYPNTKILSNSQGFTRDYGRYPYGDYKENNEFLLFPVKPLNKDLPAKERVFALLNNDNAKVYRFDKFGNGATFKSENNLIIGNQDFATAYELPSELTQLTFTFDFNTQNQTLFYDNEGNKWSLDGIALEGPRKGTQLKQSSSVIGFWFAIAAFYNTSIIQ